MKQNIAVLLVLAILTFCLPYAGLLFSGKTSDTPVLTPPIATSQTQQEGLLQPQASSAPAAQSTEAPLLILDEMSGTVLTVPMREFVIGAVAAEMPASYPEEAMKAQAVAAHSYALALKARADGSDPDLKGAYFTANPSQRLGFVTETVMRAMWGAIYEENRAKLERVVDSVLNEVLLYEGQPALACYHAISLGKTESSEAVWGSPVPYLISVDSPYDITAPEYTGTLTFTAQEMKESLELSLAGITLTGDPTTWLGAVNQTPAGYVSSVQFSGNTISGQAFRKALGLRSASFTITCDPQQKKFTVVTRGYGHGVGLSQYGANAMALTGTPYTEILAHYYPGTQLGKAA